MNALTSISITIAILLGAAIVIALQNYHKADRLSRKNKKLKDIILSFRQANNDTEPEYSVNRISNQDSGLFNRWAVCRISYTNGYWHKSVIKVFTDDDDDFNRRQADELCEALNS